MREPDWERSPFGAPAGAPPSLIRVFRGWKWLHSASGISIHEAFSPFLFCDSAETERNSHGSYANPPPALKRLEISCFRIGSRTRIVEELEQSVGESFRFLVLLSPGVREASVALGSTHSDSNPPQIPTPNTVSPDAFGHGVMHFPPAFFHPLGR